MAGAGKGILGSIAPLSVGQQMDRVSEGGRVSHESWGSSLGSVEFFL